MKVQDLINANQNDVIEYGVEIAISIKLSNYYDSNSRFYKVLTRGRKGTYTVLEFSNELFVEKMREFYPICKNEWIKNFITDICKKRQMTKKQLEVITKEMSKYNDFEYTY